MTLSIENPCPHCRSKHEPEVKSMFGQFNATCQTCGAWTEFRPTMKDLERTWNGGYVKAKAPPISLQEYKEACWSKGIKPDPNIVGE